jgi:hypothetical protein
MRWQCLNMSGTGHLLMILQPACSSCLCHHQHRLATDYTPGHHDDQGQLGCEAARLTVLCRSLATLAGARKARTEAEVGRDPQPRVPRSYWVMGDQRPGPARLGSHVPNTCRNQLDTRLIRSSDGLRLPVYKTAALPTELHRRITRCIVADPHSPSETVARPANSLRPAISRLAGCQSGSVRLTSADTGQRRLSALNAR